MKETPRRRCPLEQSKGVPREAPNSTLQRSLTVVPSIARPAVSNILGWSALSCFMGARDTGQLKSSSSRGLESAALGAAGWSLSKVSSHSAFS